MGVGDKRHTHQTCKVDPYGASAPEEFFAVTSEAFFVNPTLLLAGDAPVYALLRRYFRTDPAARRALQVSR